MVIVGVDPELRMPDFLQISRQEKPPFKPHGVTYWRSLATGTGLHIAPD
jgi:hypothetical protein